MKDCITHHWACDCREAKFRRILEQAIQDLGAPRMTYAPKIEIKELRNIVKRVSRNLLKELKQL